MKVTPQINAPLIDDWTMIAEELSLKDAESAKRNFDKHGIDGTEEFETYSMIVKMNNYYVVNVYEIENHEHHFVYALNRDWITNNISNYIFIFILLPGRISIW